MKPPRRRFLHLVAGTAAVPTAAVLGQGTITPTAAIRIVERPRVGHVQSSPSVAFSSNAEATDQLSFCHAGAPFCRA